MSSSPEPLDVLKHEWYLIVTKCLVQVFGASGLTKVAKNCHKNAKSSFYDILALQFGGDGEPANSRPLVILILLKL